MRVLFDAFWWAAGPMANRTVLRELVLAWRRVSPADEMVLAVRSSNSTLSDLPAGALAAPTRMFPHALVNAVELPFLARRHKADVVVAHNYTPLVGASCVFIHDLLFEEHPEWFSLKERAYFAPMGLLASRAAHVATSSQTEAERIHRLHPGAGAVQAIGLAVSSHLAQVVPEPLPQVVHLDAFVLSVGRLNARKNLDVVIEGAMRASTVTVDRPLLIVGSAEYSGAEANLPATVAEHVASGRVVFLGRISDAELRWLYERADALVFLSLDEGFGLPPVEARHFGAPVIVSDIPVMREVVGSSGTFVSPTSPSEVAEAIDRVGPRPDWSPERPERASDLEWDGIARRWRESIVTKLNLGQ